MSPIDPGIRYRTRKSLSERQQDILRELELGARSYYQKFTTRAIELLMPGHAIVWERGGRRLSGVVVRVEMHGLYKAFIYVRNNKTRKVYPIRFFDYFKTEQFGLTDLPAQASDAPAITYVVSESDPDLNRGCDGNDDVA